MTFSYEIIGFRKWDLIVVRVEALVELALMQFALEELGRLRIRSWFLQE